MEIVSSRLITFTLTSLVMLMMARVCWAERPLDRGHQATDLLAGTFHWKVSEPLVAPMERPDDPCYSIKDPSSDESWQPKYQVAYSVNTNIADPTSWSELKPLGAKQALGKSGLDFWIICDDAKSHLFFTTLDGNMWHEETPLESFPAGWSEATLAIRGDIFEASHTYRLKGLGKYLTLVEAQGGHGWRYYKAYLADELDGEWTPLAARRIMPLQAWRIRVPWAKGGLTPSATANCSGPGMTTGWR